MPARITSTTNEIPRMDTRYISKVGAWILMLVLALLVVTGLRDRRRSGQGISGAASLGEIEAVAGREGPRRMAGRPARLPGLRPWHRCLPFAYHARPPCAGAPAAAPMSTS